MPRIDLRSDLTLANAFRFPVQSRAACLDLAIGGFLLFLPGIGFMLNMGYRLQLVGRLQRGKVPWPGWNNWGTILRRGAVATTSIVVYHLPALICFLAALVFRSHRLFLLSLALGGAATFFLPGFMTFYAADGDVQHVISPVRAWVRVLKGGPTYLKAWAIGICGCALSFLGLLFFGVGFAWTSVWFWQVAAFCFSRVFSHQYDLLRDVSLPGGDGSAS